MEQTPFTALKTRTPRIQRPAEKRGLIFWISIAFAAVLGVTLVVTLHYVFEPKIRPPQLDDEFRDFVRTTNTATDIALRPPHHWQIDDRHEPYTLFVKCPGFKGFAPLIEIHTLPWAGKLPGFVEEHNARLKIEEPSTVILKQEDDSLDGCPAVRIEYECDYRPDDSTPSFKIHALQYVLRDPGYPMFYKITCFARKSNFDEYRALFEASVHTLRRLEIKPVIPD